MADGYLRQLRANRAISGQFTVSTAQTGPVTLQACRNASYKIFVQHYDIQLTTGSTGKTWSLQDSGTGPVIAGALAMDSAPNIFTADLGPRGAGLAIGKDLILTISAAGAGGVVVWDGYMAPAATVDSTAGAGSQ